MSNPKVSILEHAYTTRPYYITYEFRLTFMSKRKKRQDPFLLPVPNGPRRKTIVSALVLMRYEYEDGFYFDGYESSDIVQAVRVKLILDEPLLPSPGIPPFYLTVYD